MHPRNRRPAASLIETLVVIAIIAVMIGLLLSAVQRARDSAQRLVCSNRLRQAAAALHMHADAHAVLPSNGGWDQSQTILAKSGKRVVVYTHVLRRTDPFWFGVGDPALRPAEQTGPWCYAILPYLEQEAMHRQRAWTSGLEAYNCAARRSHRPQAALAKDEYAAYEGGGWEWGKTDFAANALVFMNRPRCARLADLQAGTSQVMLIGEKALKIPNYETGTWFYDEPFFVGGSDGTKRSGGDVVRDGIDSPFVGLWGSPHASGAMFAFADGSVRLVPFGTKRFQSGMILGTDH